MFVFVVERVVGGVGREGGGRVVVKGCEQERTAMLPERQKKIPRNTGNEMCGETI